MIWGISGSGTWHPDTKVHMRGKNERLRHEKVLGKECDVEVAFHVSLHASVCIGPPDGVTDQGSATKNKIPHLKIT